MKTAFLVMMLLLSLPVFSHSADTRGLRVVANMHLKRHPDFWKGRTAE
jgi:hypothetical protein